MTSILVPVRQVTGTVRHSVDVEEDAEIDGMIQCSVNVGSRATVILRGKIQGSTRLEPGCRLAITGAQEGSVTVLPGAEVIVERGGKLAGSLHNDGTVVVRGTRRALPDARGTSHPIPAGPR